MASRAVQPAGEGTRGPQQPPNLQEGGAERSKGGMQRVGGWEELGTGDGAGIALHSYSDTVEKQT